MNKMLSKEEEELFEQIVKRREGVGDKYWPRNSWDYTEWEEAMDEFSFKRKRL